MSILRRWWETVRHLKPEQVFFRLYYPLKRRLYRPPAVPPEALRHAVCLPVLPLTPLPEHDRADPETGLVDWLNRPHRFDEPDWRPSGYGALWDYHLHQFTWLERMPPDHAATHRVLQNRATATTTGTGDDPYPSSLRLVAASRWLLRSTGRPLPLLNLLYRDAHRIAAFPERHLLANHLLQNAIALLHGGLLFGTNAWVRQAACLLTTEVDRQFLADGAHIERSVSYHAQLVGGLLKCLYLLQTVRQQAPESLSRQLETAVSRGLGWLEALPFPDGSFPAFGDSNTAPEPALEALRAAAATLGITPERQALGASGYRRLDGAGWMLFANVGTATPAYQPGHAHADALSFCLHASGRPVIVDTGISTYDRSARRLSERSTAAHNTVVVDGRDSAGVWASFRMGRRASVTRTEDRPDRLVASHDGYQRWGVTHTRTFDCDGGVLTLRDRLNGSFRRATTYLHFHPDAAPRLEAPDRIRLGCGGWIKGDGLNSFVLEPYDWCAGFNLRRPALRLRADFCSRDAVFHFRF